MMSDALQNCVYVHTMYTGRNAASHRTLVVCGRGIAMKCSAMRCDAVFAYAANDSCRQLYMVVTYL